MKFKTPLCAALAVGVAAPHFISLSEGKAGNTGPLKAAAHFASWLSTGDTGPIADDGSQYALNTITSQLIRQAPAIRKAAMMQTDTGTDTG